MPSGSDMQSPWLPRGFRFFLFVAVGNHVLIMDSLSRRAVNLVELELAGGSARGVDFNRETDQREGDLSGPIWACHATYTMRDQATGST
jgi:hypothetical protein